MHKNFFIIFSSTSWWNPRASFLTKILTIPRLFVRHPRFFVNKWMNTVNNKKSFLLLDSSFSFIWHECDEAILKESYFLRTFVLKALSLFIVISFKTKVIKKKLYKFNKLWQKLCYYNGNEKHSATKEKGKQESFKTVESPEFSTYFVAAQWENIHCALKLRQVCM